MVNSTVVNEYIRERLEPGINNLMWKNNFLLNRFKASNLRVDPANLTTKVKCRVGANQGVANGSVIPKSGKTKTIDQTISMKQGRAFIEIDGNAVAYAPNDPEMAFMGAIAGEIGSIQDSINRNFEVTLQGKGNGVRGTINTITNTGGSAYDIVVTTDNFDWFELGMIIDTVDNGTGLDSAKFEITQTDSATATLSCTQLSVANTAAGGHYITNQLEYNDCFMGLLGLIDDGTELVTCQGINSSTYELWRARVDDNGGSARTLTKRMVDEMIIWCNRSGGCDIIHTTETLMWGLANLLEAQRQYVNVMELNGGFTGMKWAGREVMASMYARANHMNFLNSRTFGVRQLKSSANGLFNAMQMVTMGTGGNYFVADFTEGQVELFKGLIRWDFEVITVDRKANGSLRDVQP